MEPTEADVPGAAMETPSLTAPGSAMETPSLTAPGPAKELTAPQPGKETPSSTETPLLIAPGPSKETPSSTVPGPAKETPLSVAPGSAKETPLSIAPGSVMEIPSSTVPGPAMETAPGPAMEMEIPSTTTPGPAMETPLLILPGPAKETPSSTAPGPAMEMSTPGPAVEIPSSTVPGPAMSIPSSIAPGPAMETTSSIEPGPAIETSLATAPGPGMETPLSTAPVLQSEAPELQSTAPPLQAVDPEPSPDSAPELVFFSALEASNQSAEVPSTASDCITQFASDSMASIIGEPSTIETEMTVEPVPPNAMEPAPSVAVETQPSVGMEPVASAGMVSPPASAILSTISPEPMPTILPKPTISMEPVLSVSEESSPSEAVVHAPSSAILSTISQELMPTILPKPTISMEPLLSVAEQSAPSEAGVSAPSSAILSTIPPEPMPTISPEPMISMEPMVSVAEESTPSEAVEPMPCGAIELASSMEALPSEVIEPVQEVVPSVAPERVLEPVPSAATMEAMSSIVAEQASEPVLTIATKVSPAIANESLPSSAIDPSLSHERPPSPSVAIKATTATGSEPSPSVLDAPGTTDKNLVSFVDGEAVLIVDGVGARSATIDSVDGNFTGKSETTEERKEAKKLGDSETIIGDEKGLIGCKVRKKFGRRFFEGEVISFDPELKWYKVAYEDGDQEELDWGEVKRLIFPRISQEEQSGKKRSRWSNGTPDHSKRGPKKAKKIGTPSLSPKVDEANVVEVSEEDYQAQDKVKYRGLQKRIVIDTSNERGAEPFEDEMQLSESTDQTSEVKEKSSESDEEPAVEKRTGSLRKLRGKKRRSEESSRLAKRRKFGVKSDAEEDFVSEVRLRHKQKAESHLKSQETPTEQRIATRSSTGSLGAHVSPPDGRSSPRFKKVVEESQDKSKLESPGSKVLSPLGGGLKMIGRKTRKDFGGQFYTGEVVGYDLRAKYYKVRYEDGDEEELEWNELKPTIVPQEEQQVLALEAPNQAVRRFPKRRLKEHSRRIRTPKGKQRALILYDGRTTNGDLPSPARRWRKKVRTASVSVMMKGTEDWAAAPATPPMAPSRPPPRPLAAARFASASDADIFEYFGWGEVVNFEKAKCPEMRAARLLPTSSPVVHLAASRHHLAAITAAGQVWVWRNKHGNIHTRCNEWEHLSTLEEKNVILVDISGPDLDRTSAGYEAEQEDQVPDPFYLAAVCSSGEDIILQGSQPHEPVHTYQYDDETRHPGLRDALLQSNPDSSEDVGRIVQVSVGMVEAADESPFVGYITDTDRVYIRSATRDFMEEVNLVTGYTGRPIKIQCGRVYHAIIMTDDGRAWTWGQGYYPGSNSISSGFSSKWSSPFSVCQPAVGTLVGRKVVDVGCYGEDFIALTNDGDVHQWTHAVPNPAAGVYNVPATPVYGQGPSIASGDKLKQVSIGAGMCAGISECGKVHSWRTSMKGGLVGVVGSEREALTPLGRDEGYKETAIFSLGTRVATKVVCTAGSLIVVVKRKTKPRRGGKRKSDVPLKEKVIGDKAASG